MEQAKAKAAELLASGLVVSGKYCSTILPNSYKWGKLVPWLIFDHNGIEEIKDYAKKGAYSAGAHWNVTAANDEAVAKLKERGWRLLSKKDRKMSL